MCVVALALHQHPEWPILLIGNRDEFHARPAASLHVWDDGSGIVAGRDLVGGGTWLGVHPQHGRLVVVTNVRGQQPDPAKLSRGQLVRDLLTGHGRFAQPLSEELDHFNGFSLISVAVTPHPARTEPALRLTNRPGPASSLLGAGIHAFANAPLDEPCARADHLAAKLSRWIGQHSRPPESLLDLLSEQGDPALFLRNPVYGTRCSTIVAVDQAGRGRITERRYDKGGIPAGETALNFNVFA